VEIVFLAGSLSAHHLRRSSPGVRDATTSSSTVAMQAALPLLGAILAWLQCCGGGTFVGYQAAIKHPGARREPPMASCILIAPTVPHCVRTV
jgi:hypothetical protein